MRVVVTEVGWDGSIRRSALETAGLPGAGRWEYLIEQVLAVPPRYQATPGRPVYVIHAGARAVLVGEQNLAGPLYELVSMILQTGRPALAAEQPATITIAGHSQRVCPLADAGYGMCVQLSRPLRTRTDTGSTRERRAGKYVHQTASSGNHVR